MKKILVLLFLSVLYPVHGRTYYVAPAGDDANPGTITLPWGTWQKAFNTAQAGDTVWFRGGTWYPTSAANGGATTTINPPNFGNSGTAQKPICFFSYPGETPILDCKYIYSHNGYISGLFINNANFIHLKGLTIRNVFQRTTGVEAFGIWCWFGSNFTFDRMEVYNVGGNGIRYYSTVGKFPNGEMYAEYDTTLFINCDVHNCCDTFNVYMGDPRPGNAADGIKIMSDVGNKTFNSKVLLYCSGCRVWRCADDGFDLPGHGQMIIDNCWSFANGDIVLGKKTEGNGLKFATSDTSSYITRIIRKSIFAYNLGIGIGNVDYGGYYRSNGRIYNNFLYKNRVGVSQGFTNSDFPYLNNIYKNNIAFENTEHAVEPNGISPLVYKESHNNWDQIRSGYPFYLYTDTISVSNEDFKSLDWTEMLEPRKSDGSLPEINFLKLAQGSDLIDAGVAVGLPYNGTAPDLGPWEYEYFEDTFNRYPEINIKFPYDGTIFSDSPKIKIIVDVMDPDGNITKVEYYNGIIKLGEETSPPWSFTMNEVPSGNYFLTAVATDDRGARATSLRILIRVRSNIDKLFPNPNKGTFYLTLMSPLYEKAKVTIVSNDGKIVFNGYMFAEEIARQFTISNINPGIYILILASSDIMLTKKFIVE